MEKYWDKTTPLPPPRSWPWAAGRWGSKAPPESLGYSPPSGAPPPSPPPPSSPSGLEDRQGPRQRGRRRNQDRTGQRGGSNAGGPDPLLHRCVQRDLQPGACNVSDSPTGERRGWGTPRGEAGGPHGGRRRSRGRGGGKGTQVRAERDRVSVGAKHGSRGGGGEGRRHR